MQAAARDEVELAAGHLVALVERHLPGVLSSLNLVGSAVDGDFRPGHSDLDFVAVLHRPPTEEQLEGLAILHRLYAGDPTLPQLDGIWITPADLAAGPDAAAPGPATRDGVFLASAAGNRNPVTWFTLHDSGRTVLGTLDRSVIWRDPVRLASWTCENVEAYWVPWQANSSRLTTGRGLAMLGRKASAWGVLGISRLHATITTGRIISKSVAEGHARASFDARWLTILEDSLSHRHGDARSFYRSPLDRRRDALAFVAMVIEAIRTHCRAGV